MFEFLQRFFYGSGPPKQLSPIEEAKIRAELAEADRQHEILKQAYPHLAAFRSLTTAALNEPVGNIGLPLGTTVSDDVFK